MTTAHELGATVVRSQTLGDSVGCDECLEPALGQFNAEAFAHADYAIASAHRHGIRLIATIVGDDAAAGGGGCVYLAWRGISPPNCSLVNMPQFWSDPNVIGDVETHIAALLNHVNVYTHVAWKNDPTILGWDLLNGGGSPVDWTRQIAGYIRGIDTHHLVLSGYTNAGLAGVNACVSFIYPHWHMPLAMVRPWMARCARAHKPYIAYEYGWDRTNYPTLGGFESFLDTLRRTPGIAGDAFWALEAHADGHGWLPIPADTSDLDVALHGESGQWWALYYPGIRTLVSTAADMAARAQAIRRHNYAMAGVPVPPHAIPPAPRITSTAGGRLRWEGSAGAARYSVQRAPAQRGPWTTAGVRLSRAGWYRVLAFNLDGKPSRPSAAVRFTS